MPSQPSFPASPDQLRVAERFDAAVPLVVDGKAISTRNISDSGVYFETDLEQKIGSVVNLTLEFQLGGTRQRLECRAEVVRIDRINNRVGVAARLQEPLFSPVKEEIAI